MGEFEVNHLETLATKVAEKATKASAGKAKFIDITMLIDIFTSIFGIFSDGCGQENLADTTPVAFAKRAKQPAWYDRITLLQAFREKGYRGKRLRKHVNAAQAEIAKLSEADIAEAAKDATAIPRAHRFDI